MPAMVDGKLFFLCGFAAATVNGSVFGEMEQHDSACALSLA